MHSGAFRLGGTSYVVPGDLPANAAHLAGQAQDMELVLYALADGRTNLPDVAAVDRLAELAAAHDLTYTVHLPGDLVYADGERHESLRLAERVIRLMAPLRPHAYVFHLDSTHADRPGWAVGARAAIEMVLPLVETPAQLALENLESCPPETLLPVFAALPISRTLDIGHLWKMGRDPLPLLESWLPHSRVVHLHGLAERDHVSLAVMPPEQLDPVVRRLLDWPGVLTLEVFEGDFYTSRAALLEAMARVRL